MTETRMHRDRIAEMRPPIAIDAKHFARLFALSSLTNGAMTEVCEYLREKRIVRMSFPRSNCVPDIGSLSGARSNFGMNKLEKIR